MRISWFKRLLRLVFPRFLRQPPGDTLGPPSTRLKSLFGEILDWMLAPFLFLWPISIIVTHQVANGIANQPYDQALADNVRAIAQQIKTQRGKAVVNFPAPAKAVLREDEDDMVYFQVRGVRGELLVGDGEIPALAALPNKEEESTEVQFRDGEIAGEEVRIAYLYLHPDSLPNANWLLVQVAETRNKRGNLASRIVTEVLLPQFAIIPLAIVLVWLGLSRGIAPLNRLQRVIRDRRPSDLSPISVTGVPEEVRPLIVAFNEMMSRLEEMLHAQQRFIADAAHQMRTPLTGLKMQTELALQEDDPAQLRQSLEHIAQSTDRASHLINQLLLLARAEASFEKLHAVEVLDLNHLVRDIAGEFYLRSQPKRIDLGLETHHWPVLIEGTPLLLRELIKNLLDNAIKSSPVGGQVPVRTLGREIAILEIEDTGVGS